MPAGGSTGDTFKEDQRQILTASYIPFLLDALLRSTGDQEMLACLPFVLLFVLLLFLRLHRRPRFFHSPTLSGAD